MFKTCLIGKTAYALAGGVKRMFPQETAWGRVLELDHGKESIHALSRGGHVWGVRAEVEWEENPQGGMSWYVLSECWVLEPEQGEQGIHAEVVDGTQEKVYLNFASPLHKEKRTDKFGKAEKQNKLCGI